MTRLLAPVSWGELLDKIAILELKIARIAEPARRVNVARELDALRAVRDAAQPLPDEARALVAELADVNRALWEVEDALRAHEAEARFDAAFVELARSVYRHNDHRAALKRRLNALLDSELVEEKSYRPR